MTQSLLLTTYYLLPAACCLPLTWEQQGRHSHCYLLLSSCYLLPTTNYLLLTTCDLLLATYLVATTCLLPTTCYYRLPTTYLGAAGAAQPLLLTTCYSLPTPYCVPGSGRGDTAPAPRRTRCPHPGQQRRRQRPRRQ